MNITVIGMGRMGRALAGRLLDHDHRVVIWNRTPGRAPDLVARGATEAGSATEAVLHAEMVITSLANDDAVRAVTAESIHPSAAGGVVHVDASTVSPGLAAELAKGFERFASMPVLGSPEAVASGSAVFLLGGDPSVTAVVDRILPDLTQTVHRYPEPALAAAAKITANLLLLDSVVALAEAFAVGRAGGLSDDQLRELLAEAPMVAPAVRNRFEGVLTGRAEAWWSAGLGAKDAGLALDLAGQAGRDLPLTGAARDLYRRTAEASDGSEDIADVTHRYR